MFQNDVFISWPRAIIHGFLRRCPRCGKGRLFKGYLTPQDKCSICELSFEDLKADDGPAYITMGLICLFIVPFFFLMEALYEPPLEIALVLSLPLTLAIILGLLPLIKGAFMAALWKSGGKNE